KPDKPCGYGARLIRLVSDGRRRTPIIPSRNADVAQTAEIPDDLVEARVRIRRLSQACDNGLDKLAREPRDALILGLDAGGGLQHEPCDVDGETKRKHQSQEQIDAGPQGKSMPHRKFPTVSSSSSQKRDELSLNHHHRALAPCLDMIFSENRFTLFRIRRADPGR